ncbi:hypothetical protein RB195_024716 [Necator americanus]|uniref:Uncharacterized protein n=1 Tax=Necator americanus TaxID=51031 RepID=A0ABR1EPL2_NECAM
MPGICGHLEQSIAYLASKCHAKATLLNVNKFINPRFGTIAFEEGAEQRPLNAAENRLSTLKVFFVTTKECYDHHWEELKAPNTI